MSKNKKILLPSGFKDVLPPEASLETKIVSKMLKNFEQWGYEQVKPPIAEFEESLLSGQGENMDSQTFRITDQVSNKMMGIRADMTTQTARMAAIRLKSQPRPLRLSYSGQVLRAEGDGLNADRQVSQAGIEIIGNNSIASDAEAIIVAIDSLKKAGIEEISVDFSMPKLSQAIMDQEKIPDSQRKPLLELIEKKDANGVKRISELLAKLLNIAGSVRKSLEKLEKLTLPEIGKKYLNRLKNIVSEIEKNKISVSMTIDPLERRGFEYHTGISFSFFSRKSSEELGRGGRYKIDFENGEDAVGFTLSVNAIVRALPPAQANKKIFVPFGEPAKDSAGLRDKGLITLHGLEKTKDSMLEAKRLKCSFIFQKGEILPVR